MNKFILLALLVSAFANSRDSSGLPLLADGFIEVSTQRSYLYKTIRGVSTFCAYGKHGSTVGCKWMKSEDYLKFTLKRNDIEFAGMSVSSYTNHVILYFKEVLNFADVEKECTSILNNNFEYKTYSMCMYRMNVISENKHRYELSDIRKHADLSLKLAAYFQNNIDEYSKITVN
jgi:hypothetical protein